MKATTIGPKRTTAPPTSADSPLGFELPHELEAHDPPEARRLTRDAVRMMVSYRNDDRIMHARFREIDRFLTPGDLLVINTSATINAALPVASEPPSELHLSTHLGGDRWTVELRACGAAGTTPYYDGFPGMVLPLPAGATAMLEAPYRYRGATRGPRLWIACLRLPSPVHEYLAAHGFPIRYGYVDECWPIDYYQTVYATEAGSAEMPSAGRAFTPEIITHLVARGVQFTPLLLHTGVSSLEAHEPPYPEFYRVPDEAARRVNETRAAGGRVIAIGTTVVRALETVTDEEGATRAGEGWTDIVVTPEGGVRSMDGLLTGLHEPRASHLQMLEAIAGRHHLRIAYAAALRERYLWHEFGDLHLILP